MNELDNIIKIEVSFDKDEYEYLNWCADKSNLYPDAFIRAIIRASLIVDKKYRKEHKNDKRL